MGPWYFDYKKPSKTELKDIEFGRKIAKELADADIGHTVIVKDRAVLALEAIEGTDEAIKRGGKLGGEGAVVLKSSRPNQDLRLDMPVIGPNTIEAMAEVKSSCLAFDANMTLILEKDKVISIANANNIAIVSML